MKKIIIVLLLAGCADRDQGSGLVLGSDLDKALDRCFPHEVDSFTIRKGEPNVLNCTDGRRFEKYAWIGD